MLISYRIKTDTVRFLELVNMIRSSTLRAFTLTHRMVFSTLLKELQLALILDSQGSVSESDSSGRR